jgi:hypothetical protein
VRHIVAFRKINGSVQLLARNTRFDAPGDPGLARTARLSFSDSLLGAAPIASAEHPERRSVLIELSPILLADLPQLSRQLEAQFRVAYALDPRNSFFGPARSSLAETVVPVSAHYALPRLPTLSPGGQQPSGPPPSLPRNLEDARSFFVDYRYSFASLPEPVMRPRRADPRIGHFTVPLVDWSDAAAPDPRRHVVTRWRLDKKDPSAALSSPCARSCSGSTATCRRAIAPRSPPGCSSGTRPSSASACTMRCRCATSRPMRRCRWPTCSTPRSAGSSTTTRARWPSAPR